MEWWERVRDLVDQRGIRQVDLAEQIGTRQGTVSNVLNGRARNARRETLEAYARALGVSVQWLLTGQEEVVQLDEADVFTRGRAVFEEWVAAKDPALVAQIPAFLRRAEEQAHRWSALTTAFDVAEQMIADFRAWRRGEWDREEPAGVPYVRTKRG